MKKRIAAVLVAIGGALLFWRRDSLQEDSKRIADAAQGAATTARRRIEDRLSAKRIKYAELGHLVHQVHADPSGGDRQAEINGLLADIDEIIAAEAADDDQPIDLTDSSLGRPPADQPV